HHGGDGVGVVIHVDEGRGAAADHFPAGQFGADAHEFRVHELHLCREDVVVEPGHQLEVVGNAAKERHGGVRVAVDEAGKYDAIVTGQPFRRLVLAVDPVGGTDGDDHALVDGHGTVPDDVHALVHGDEVV